MTALALSAPQTSPWRIHAAALALVAIVLLALFARDVADLTHIWWTSTTFAHCLFIVPVVGWLVWTRRVGLAELTPVAWWPGLALVAAGGFGWLLGDAAAVALVRQVALVTMLVGAAVTLLGPNVARALAFPLAYLLFAVPFGEELEPPLQDLTVAMVMPMLGWAGIPAAVDGVLIHAGRYWFEVAEACSGAKFVIAMLAYGALVANVCFTSWRRRAAFMAMALVVPVLANAVRAWGTIVAADRFGIERATGFDHIVYGWVFFAVAMALVMALGWRWFDRAPDDPVFEPARLQAPPRRTLDLGVAALLTVGVALLPIGWSAAGASAAVALPERLRLPDVPGWRLAPLDTRVPWSPYYPAADRLVLARYADVQGQAVDLSVAAFAGQREGAELIAFGTGVLREGDRWIRVEDQPRIAGGSAMRIVTAAPGGASVERVVATWYRVGGGTSADPLRVKLATTVQRLSGGDQRAVAVHVSAPVVEGEDARAAIARFVAAAGGIDAVADGALAR